MILNAWEQIGSKEDRRKKKEGNRKKERFFSFLFNTFFHII
jgi:hypothetical protein